MIRHGRALLISGLGCVLAAGVSGGLGVSARAQPVAQAAPPRDAAREEADRAFDAMDWRRAADAYQQVVRRDAKQADAWFHLGVALAELGEYGRAAEALDRAGELGLSDSPTLAWQAAVVNAKLRRAARTVEWLATVVDGGLRSGVLTSAPDFEFLRSDPAFQALVARAVGNDRSCAAPVYRALDFWVGDWAIYNEDRVRVGTSRVAKTPDGCAVVETWSGTLGDGGRSLTFYNERTGRWRQVWVGDAGGVVEQEGTVEGGALRLQGETTRPDGTRVLARLTLAPGPSGRLRQRAEVSRDGGRTWTVQFDFTGVRAGPSDR
jgi:hypothetical protein